MISHLPYDTETIRYEETDMSFLHVHPCHFKCGVYIICTRGECTISTGVEEYVMDSQSELILLTGGLVLLKKISDDFMARMLLIPQNVFLKAVLPIDTPYFNYTHEHPFYKHTSDERSQKTWKEVMLWMDMAEMLFGATPKNRYGKTADNQYDKTTNNQCGKSANNQFRNLQEHNFTQSMLMWLFNTIPEKIEVGKTFTRKQMLCHQFLKLVRENSIHERQVAYYAGKLCITTRYLNRIISECMDGRSPKSLIDEQITAEIKVLLNEPALSVTEIAEMLNFADQSYLTRFFKKNTGMSPMEYRRQNKETPKDF